MRIIRRIGSTWNIIRIWFSLLHVVKELDGIEIADSFFRRNTTKQSLSRRVVALIDDEIRRGKTFETQQSLSAALFFKAMKHWNIDQAKTCAAHCIKIWTIMYMRIKDA